MKTPIALGLAALLVTIAVATGFGPLLDLDHTVATGLHSYALDHPGWVTALQTWTDVFQPWTFRALLVGIAVLPLARRRTRTAAWVLVSVLVAGAVESGAKALLGRARPHWAHPVSQAVGGSFPSGHALTSAVGCGVLLVLAWPVVGRATRRALAVAAVAVPAITGFTRLALGVHFLSDVIGGWLIAATIVTALLAAWPIARTPVHT